MKVLVLNCGSSSLKYQLIDMSNEEVLASGKFERIGEKESFLVHKVNGKKIQKDEYASDHSDAIKFVLEALTEGEDKVVNSLEEIDYIGHRLVHGGDEISDSVEINDKVVAVLEDNIKLAPLHNKACILGIKACQKVVPNKKMVGVFDTAFHQSIPKDKYLYPIDYKYYENLKVRKYGFHGTSHKFVSQRLGEILGKDIKDLKIITCHLGQGSSITAIKDGKSIETSMGLTPLAGIPMVTRSRTIDPSVITYIMKEEKLTPEQMEDVLNKQSGLSAVAKMDPDFRIIEEDSKKGNENAKIAVEMFTYEIASYITRCMVALGGADYIIFTGGIGENQIDIRRNIIEKLGFLGAKLDVEKNNVRSVEQKISSDDSSVEIYIIPTNEELMIAKETMRVLDGKE